MQLLSSPHVALSAATRSADGRNRMVTWHSVAALIVPLATYNLTLKAIRITHHPGEFELVSRLVLLLSDLFTHLAFVVLCVGIFGSLATRRSRSVTLAGLQLLAVLWILLVTAAHHYFLATGSTLDFALVAFNVLHLPERVSVLASETSWSTWFLAPVTVFILAGPWALRKKGRPPSPRSRTARYLCAGVSCVLTAGLAAAALFPRVEGTDATFARDPLLHTVVTGFQSGHYDKGHFELWSTHRPRGAISLRPRTDDRRNVVIVILESTGAAATTPYNPLLDTTPFLQELSKRSVLVERAYSVVPYTSKALVAILGGIEPRPGLALTESFPGGMPGRCLADLLGEQGYQTVYFQSATKTFEERGRLVRNLGFADFFPGDEMDHEGFERSNYFGYEDDIMLAPSRRWLETHGRKPFFASYLTIAPHHDYLAPSGRYGRQQFDTDPARNRWLNAIRNQDFFLRHLFQQYQELGLVENTVFVIVGDHGEGFGEHGRNTHAEIMWNEVLHVPMIVHDLSQALSTRITHPVTQLDIVPTVLDLLGFDVASGTYAGQSIFAEQRDRLIMAACYADNKCAAVVDGNWKFIHHFNLRPDELFDLTSDVQESRNLADLYVGQIQQWRADLLRWQRSVRAMHQPGVEDPLAVFVRSKRPAVQHRVGAQFGDYAVLLGYDLVTREIHMGQPTIIKYHFEVLKRLPPGCILFVRGNGETQRLVLDHEPVLSLYPVEDWRPGIFVTDAHSFTLPCDYRDSYVQLELGFEIRGGERLPVTGAAATDHAVRITRLPVRH